MTTRSSIATFFIVCMAAYAAPQSSNLAGIAHVALRVADLEKSRAFYEKLGFEQAFQFHEAGKVSQEFIKINDRQFIELYPRTQGDQSIGLMHVCYESDKIDEVRAACLKQGLTSTEVKKARAGNLLFVLHDREAGVVEYTQYLPGSLHSEDRGKHLGERRISNHLETVTIPVKDVTSEAAFYIDKLGFHERRSSAARALLIPGSTDGIILVSSADQNRARLGFAIASFKPARSYLRAAGLNGRRAHHSIVVDDPDGNEIVFKQGTRQVAVVQR